MPSPMGSDGIPGYGRFQQEFGLSQLLIWLKQHLLSVVGFVGGAARKRGR